MRRAANRTAARAPAERHSVPEWSIVFPPPRRSAGVQGCQGESQRMARSFRFRAAHAAAIVSVAASATFTTPIAVAHHSVGGEFDAHRKVTLSGVVSQVEWANPHIYLHFAVKEPSGAITEWRLETVPVAMMRKAGLTKAQLMSNAQNATVDINPARDGTQHMGYLLKITYADGHHYQFGADTPARAPGSRSSAPPGRSP
jgi:Family of unknown function (DUF6152)